jgi:rod shape-determining protein MreC
VAFPRRSSRTPRSRATIGLLLLTAITVLVLDLPGTGPLDPIRNVIATAFRPVRAAGSAVFEPISNGWKGAFGYDDVREENDRLREQLEEQKGLEAEVERLQQDNEELRKINGITIEDVPTKAVKVVSGPISSFEQVVQVDIGSSGHVKAGMAVITGGGVLGRVADTGAGRATVDLITTPGLKLGVATKQGDLGTVEGQGPDDPLILEIDDEVRLREGDLIYTSGIDRSAFPGELPVGKVSKITEADDGVARRVEVEPTADLASRYVRIVLREAPR